MTLFRDKFFVSVINLETQGEIILVIQEEIIASDGPKANDRCPCKKWWHTERVTHTRGVWRGKGEWTDVALDCRWQHVGSHQKPGESVGGYSF